MACFCICDVSADVIFFEACWTGLAMLRPPKRTGRAVKFLSSVLISLLPVRAGMNLLRMMSSRGWDRCPIPSIVLAKKVHL